MNSLASTAARGEMYFVSRALLLFLSLSYPCFDQFFFGDSLVFTAG